MFHTFSYNSSKNEIILASRVWSDFGAHIPLIRSFSFGSNWPIEYPLYPGEKIRYHFLFYSIVGFIEKTGVRIDYALNIPSALGFFALLLLIYTLSTYLFKRKVVGILSAIFFLFNGTLSFIPYVKTFPNIIEALYALPTIRDFPSFGPWDDSLVTAFGHLNVYTNQRHLAPSFAIVLLVIYLLLTLQRQESTSPTKSKTIQSLIITLFPLVYFRRWKFTIGWFPISVCIALLFSSLLFMNQPALLSATIVAIGFFLFYPNSRLPLMTAFFLSVPFLLLFFTIAETSGFPILELGYLSKKPFTIQSGIEFWIHNLGLHLIFFPIGMLIAPKKTRWLALPIIVIFILPNVFRFSTDMINNHKFINMFMIFANMYTAYTLVEIFGLPVRLLRNINNNRLHVLFPSVPLESRLSREKWGFLLLTSYFISFLFCCFCFIFLILSGIIDFFVIKNDYYIKLLDIPNNKDAQFIHTNLPRDTVILNSTWFYHPASIAGRKIYNGYAFFTWSAGYDTYKRESIVKEIYQSNNRNIICSLLKKEQISYVDINTSPEEFIKPISHLWLTLSDPLYDNKETGFKLYDVNSICKQ